MQSLLYPVDIPRAERALAGFDVSDKLFDRVDCLSGGKRQRAGLARALVSEATLLLVDEPLSALDPTRSQHAIETLTWATRERGATLVATLHHVEMALAHFPRIVGVRNGAVAFGPVRGCRHTGASACVVCTATARADGARKR